MRKISFLIVGFIFALWLGGKINALILSPEVGVVLLSNETSQEITSAHVTICGQEFEFSNVPKGGFAVARYNVTSDSHYDVKVLLRSGHRRDGKIGYVTHGADFFDVVEVSNEELILRNLMLGQ